MNNFLFGRSLFTAYFAGLNIDDYKTGDPSTECWTFSPELALNYQGKVMKKPTKFFNLHLFKKTNDGVGWKIPVNWLS